MSLRPEEVAQYTHRSDEDVPAPVRHGLVPLVGTRRQFLKGAATAGVGVALGFFGSVPLPRVASGITCLGSLQDDMDGACSSVNDGFGCDPACGSSMVYPNACNAATWHKHTGDWRNRPNDCSSTDPTADGWFWNKCCTSQCAGRLSRFKCHDGCKLVSGAWKTSVCRTFICQQQLC
jgi:hypothetical protein